MGDLLLVVGPGRSGTSLCTGILGHLGVHVPQPEVSADESNPRGFSEPQWVVDFHEDLLRRAVVAVNDSRPTAFADTHKQAQRAAATRALRAWLQQRASQHPSIVVKDPRTTWFLPLWGEVARELGLRTTYVIMLRHPSEVVASARTHYGRGQSGASRAAAWINITLHTELYTRGHPRAFVRYADLLTDWRSEVHRLGRNLGLALEARAGEAETAATIDRFVEPALRRQDGTTWLDIRPAAIRELADTAWEEVLRVKDTEPSAHGDPGRLETLRGSYDELYAEIEAAAYSTIVAEGKRPRPRRPLRSRWPWSRTA